MKKKNEPDKLLQEARQALAAGMSYGKWKALQPQKQQPQQTAIPADWKPCPYCGKYFAPKKGKRFCDEPCRKSDYRKRTGK